MWWTRRTPAGRASRPPGNFLLKLSCATSDFRTEWTAMTSRAGSGKTPSFWAHTWSPCPVMYPELLGTYLVAVSGYGQPDDQRRAKEAGFDLHMIKPVESNELQRVLAELPSRVTC